MNFENYVDSETCYGCIDNTDSFGNPDNFNVKKFIKKVAPFALPPLAIAIKAKELKQAKQKQKAQKRELQQFRDAATVSGGRPATTATNTLQNESMQTMPGQIGTEAGAVTMPAASAQQQSMGGGGGGFYPDEDINTVSPVESQQTAAGAKELPGVTVTSKKTNWLLIIGVAAAVIILILVLSKSKK